MRFRRTIGSAPTEQPGSSQYSGIKLLAEQGTMFIGHFAVGFAAKRYAPRTSLGLLIAAPNLADMLWPFFLLLGVEHVRIDPGNTKFTPLDLWDFPWSHSLLMLFVWATLFAAAYWWFSRYWPGTIAIWLGVLSHWLLDWITHRPDMPLYPGGPRFGLGLWNSITGTLVVEIAMYVAGIWMYFKATHARDWIGRWACAAFIVLLFATYIGDRFGGPPDSVKELAWTGIVAEAVLLPWAWWFDRHRQPNPAGN
jgi:LexA-binding, inner membrane-associated putative hydrolase